jgi:uncharacterized RmlC-like cupin family protein
VLLRDDQRAPVTALASRAGDDLARKYGVRYFEPGETAVAIAAEDNLYYYEAYIGEHELSVERGDSLFWLSADADTAHLARGPRTIRSTRIATVIRGYMPEDKTSTVRQRTTLPYVNGCSAKQVFPPERPGDPTLQLLYIPPHTSEQAHHIHSTVRVVYVLRGSGHSVVGMEKAMTRESLRPGKVAIFEPMCPHHFETDAEPLVCVPLHVFSSVGARELNHPMHNGTYVLDDGGGT